MSPSSGDSRRLGRFCCTCAAGFHHRVQVQIAGRCWVGLVVSVSASHTVGCWSEKCYKLPPCIARMCKGRSLTVQPDCLKWQVVCGTVYGDMHLKDFLRSITRVGYCVPVPNFYLVLHGLCCQKKLEWINHNQQIAGQLGLHNNQSLCCLFHGMKIMLVNASQKFWSIFFILQCSLSFWYGQMNQLTE